MTELADLGRLARALASLMRLSPEALDSCLVAAVEADLPAIMQMRREVIGADLTWDDGAYLRWRYRLDGPPARTVAETPPDTSHLWLFKRGDEVLGCLGAENLTVAAPTGRYRAIRFLDLMSLPKFNGLGIGAWLNLKLIPQVVVAIAIGASDQSIGMLGRLFHRMPDRRAWGLPLRTAPLVAARWPQSQHVPLLGTATRAADVALSLKRRVDRRIAGERLEVFETTAPDDAVARLSESMVRAGYTLTPRSAAYWRWRFLENPRRRCRLHVACRGDATVAMVVSARNGEVGELIDWVWDASQGDDVAQSVLLTLFTTVIDRFADAGATKARALTYDQVSEAVCARIGMRQRPTRAAYAIRAETAELERQLLDARWFVTLGDSDGD